MIVLIGYGAFRPKERGSFHGQDRGLIASARWRAAQGRRHLGHRRRPKARIWTDATGQFSVTAEFIELSLGKVTLREANGATVRVPLRRLSESDQQYVREHAK